MVIIQTLDVGGAEMDILRNFPHIHRSEGYEVVLCVFGKRGVFYERAERAGLRIISRDDQPDQKTHSSCFGRINEIFRSLFFIYQTIHRERPNLVHAFLPRAYLFTSLVRKFIRKSDRPILVMSRLSLNFYMDKYPLLRWFETSICHKDTDAFIGNSKAILSDLRQEGCKESLLHLIYNGIETQQFANERHASDFKSPFHIVCVGNLYRYKGYDDLIDACEILVKCHPSLKWILEIAGEDREDNLVRLQSKVLKLGLKKRIKFLGYVENVSALLGRAHLFVHPSHTEGLPNAVIEAMSAGLPVVASNVGGMPELIASQENGLLIDASDPEGLASSIADLLNAPERMFHMGLVGQARAESIFTLDASIKKYIEVYDFLQKPLRSFISFAAMYALSFGA